MDIEKLKARIGDRKAKGLTAAEYDGIPTQQQREKAQAIAEEIRREVESHLAYRRFCRTKAKLAKMLGVRRLEDL
jgi:hypothetical protein